MNFQAAFTTLLPVLSLIGVASAQTYPSKPIHVYTTETGGGTDLTARAIGQRLSIVLGQPIIVENKGAAGGAIAAVSVANSAPDGHTLLYYGTGIWTLPLMRKNAGYDLLRDFSPISIATSAPYFLYMNPLVPANSVSELIAYAKKYPGKLNYGAPGLGSSPHLAGELFKSMAGVDVQRVPYKSTGATITDLLANQLQIVFGTGASGLPHVKTGKLKVLGIASDKPSILAPDIPTIAATGLPDFEISSKAVMFAPGKTPAAIVRRISEEIAKVLAEPEIRKRFLAEGIEPVGTTPEQSLVFIKGDIARWAKIIDKAGMQEE